MNAEQVAMVEGAVRAAFWGMERKNGDPMADHSLEVGRLVALHPLATDEAVFAGYCHDIPEDTAVGADELARLALRVFGGDAARAEDAVRLTLECCYTDEEYALPKAERKRAACARWSGADDIRVALVKFCDVESNAASARSVSEQFEREYLAWAGPLREELRDRLSGASAPSP